MRWRALYSNK